jgi:hypothetical protein
VFPEHHLEDDAVAAGVVMTEPRPLSDPERTVSYDGRRFRLILSGGTPTARSALLEFRQHGDVVVGQYSGDGIEHGSLIAVVRAMACLEGRFQHVASGLRLETGRFWATPQHTPRGQMRLYFEWHMGSQEGVSVMEEA